MARGRKANTVQVQCERCGRKFLQNGLATHQRSCARLMQAAAGGNLLVLPATDVPGYVEPGREGSGRDSGEPYRDMAALQEEHADPPPSVNERRGPLEVVFGYSNGFEGQHADASTAVNSDANAAGVNADAATDENAGAAAPSSALKLPSFRPPTLRNAPKLVQDDFLTVHHPHAQRPPTIQRFEEFDRRAPDVEPSKLPKTPWDPFRSRADFEFAQFTQDTSLNQKEINRLLDIIDGVANGKGAISFRTYRDVKNAWDAASYRAPAYTPKTLTVRYKTEDRMYEMHSRDPFEWAITLVKDPLLAPHFVWHSQRLYKYTGKEWERFVDEPSTADRWWDVDSALPEGGSALCYILYADKTRLSSFGTQKGYPIMARLANLSSHIRNGDGHGGGQIIGFLPLVEDENEEKKKGFTNHKRIVWHAAFEVLLEKVKAYGTTGYSCHCGDDIIRILYPVILMLVADYEEQAVMALIRGPNGLMPCPSCEVPAEEQKNLAVEPQHPTRDYQRIQEIVEDESLTKGAMESLLKPLGLRAIKNVFWEMPHCNVYRALSWDRLHAYHGGLFSDHLFAEFQSILGVLGRPAVTQVNRQFDGIPRWSDLNHFSEVAAVNFTDGTKYEDISKVIVPASYNVFPRKACPRGYALLKCLRCYIVLDVLSGLDVHTASTLDMYTKGLVKFSNSVKEYEQEYDLKNWNFPKDHTHQHVKDDVVEKGVTKNYNGKLFERMHGSVKEIYSQQTNFKNVDVQIAEIEHRRMVAQGIRAHLDFLDKVEQKPQEETRNAVRLRSEFFRFSHIQLGSLETHTFTDVEQSHLGDTAFHRFRLRLQEYLNESYSTSRWLKLRSEDEIVVSRYIQVDYESRVTWKLSIDYLRCNPSFHGRPRFDYVIYKVDDGLIGFAQLRLVFVCEFEGTRYPIAHIDDFGVVEHRRRIDTDLGLCRVRRNEGSRFIPATSIIRGALLAEAFTVDGQTGRDKFVIDTVDGDMYLRLGEDVPIWRT
ncbi:hypothetical protein GY45DRAFT_1291847 [Cubamyces sp. BRFM 1775]|nr:hypothetical protein GY45DRAFT_1291847 [Cubamyces sp. BRFM 1775]